ncbi:MAG: MogA/MoaB family molybdenum cofactor biosynthesis protein [Anaerolineales bacterium]|nr:MogA/MoaB family molybdenum cofactor biosynthesis protein [Anaerolineales bacterium]
MNLQFGIITISDRSASGERSDASGPAIMELVRAKGWEVAAGIIIPDDYAAIRDILIEWAEREDIDVLLTTGGTGFARRDNTPEATCSVIERFAPGLVEAMRAESAKKTSYAMLSRAVAGIRRNTLIVNLPGSPKGAVENLQVILPVLEHAVKLLRDEDAGH